MRRWHHWPVRVLIALDELGNALTGGAPDETISSRCGKRLRTCLTCRLLCRAIDLVAPGHCRRAIEPDRG